MSNTKDFSMKSGPSAQPKVTLADSTPVNCSKCGHNMFMETYHIRKFSSILTGEPDHSYMPLSIMTCVNCAHPQYQILPQPVQALLLKDLQDAQEARKHTVSGDTNETEA